MGIGGKNKDEEKRIVPESVKEDSNFDKLTQEILKGMAGGNKGIPMGFNRLNRYIGIRRTTYYLIGGLTGSGKTSFIDDAFVLTLLIGILKIKIPLLLN